MSEADSYLAVCDCVRRADREGALAVAELVDAQTEGRAGVEFVGLDISPLTGDEMRRLGELVKIAHPLTEMAVSEFREIISSTFPTDYGRALSEKEIK
jgi:hypothetical protein